jgi:hypothetical protein
MTISQVSALEIPIINCSFNNTTLLSYSEYFLSGSQGYYYNKTSNYVVIIWIFYYKIDNHKSTDQINIFMCRILPPFTDCHTNCPPFKVSHPKVYTHSNFLSRSLNKANAWVSFYTVRCLTLRSGSTWSSICRNLTTSKCVLTLKLNANHI